MTLYQDRSLIAAVHQRRSRKHSPDRGNEARMGAENDLSQRCDEREERGTPGSQQNQAGGRELGRGSRGTDQLPGDTCQVSDGHLRQAGLSGRHFSRAAKCLSVGVLVSGPGAAERVSDVMGGGGAGE
ncbi:hypothetical protein AAFF_G00441150 [Aldrovandia affinis]|uniref:Uncharacterized protein n=1 Tax=Aldrovandia affinis TaxID=143900 RepID=A0AAD7S9L6_9TELE|nr:hypothetical protein AAFF_G00441150 [Aldrovandia affinis]